MGNFAYDKLSLSLMLQAEFMQTVCLNLLVARLTGCMPRGFC